MLTFDVPLVAPGVSGSQAYQTMKQAHRSAAVSLIGQTPYFIEAGAAFVAWKLKLPFDILTVGVQLEPFDGSFNPPPGQPKRLGLLQLQSVDVPGLRAMVVSRREAWAHRYSTGPAACYCLQCESPGKPATCQICAGTVDCA